MKTRNRSRARSRNLALPGAAMMAGLTLAALLILAAAAARGQTLYPRVGMSASPTEYIDTLESLGHEQDAYLEVRKIRTQSTDDPRLLKRAASMFFERNELDQALEYVQRGIKATNDPSDPHGFSTLSASINRKIAERNLEALRLRRTTEPNNLDLFFQSFFFYRIIKHDHAVRAGCCNCFGAGSI